MPRTYVLFLDNTPPTRSRLQFIPPPEEEGEFLLWYVKVVEFDHFKIRIINLFPCSQIFQCIPISQPVLYYV